MKNKLFIILIFLFGALASCTKDTVKPTVQPSVVAPIKLSTDLQPFLTTNCATCHDNQGSQDPDLTQGDTYNALINGSYINTTTATSSKLYTKINTGGSMASHSNPTFTTKVLQWIQQGAQNN